MNPPTRTRKSARGDSLDQQSASCGACSERWTGTTACHCGACHRTFTGGTAFDAHRRGRCLRPESVGLVRNERGRWAWPPMTDDEKRRRFGA